MEVLTLPERELFDSMESDGIVVMTPIGPGEQPFLSETISSVVDSFHSSGVDLTWVLCGGYGVKPVDDTFAHHGIEVEHIRVGAQAQWGKVTMVDNTFGCPPGVGRNMVATSAPDGSWLMNMDADDIMLPSRVDMVSQCDGDIMYHMCSASDVLPDGSIVEYPTESGILDMGWRQDRNDIHFTTLSIRREILLAVGGYPGVVCCEDTLLCDKLSTLPVVGKVDSGVGCLYRKGHGTNVTMQDYDASSIFKVWG